jgi:hypothetical protein
MDSTRIGWGTEKYTCCGEKMYLGSSIIMEIYPALSLAIRGWDGMD